MHSSKAVDDSELTLEADESWKLHHFTARTVQSRHSRLSVSKSMMKRMPHMQRSVDRSTRSIQSSSGLSLGHFLLTALGNDYKKYQVNERIKAEQTNGR